MQWNDRYRDDVRGFLRGEGGLVAALIQRVQGSPDLFDAPTETVNFLTCHDGFTLYDLVAYDRKHNEANGHGNHDGAGDNRSWNCGWEGDDGVPDEVLALRRRQLRNAWCLLAMSHGVPMVAMGDEFGRTQGGNNNAYNQDNETSWVDWDAARRVRRPRALRRRAARPAPPPPALAQPAWWGDAVQWFGTSGPPDTGDGSRSLAWHVGDLYVIANACWEPLTFAIQAPGPVASASSTRRCRRRTTSSRSPRRQPSRPRYDVAARSVVILERQDGGWSSMSDPIAATRQPCRPAALCRHDSGWSGTRRLRGRLRHPGEHRPVALPRRHLHRQPDVACRPLGHPPRRAPVRTRADGRDHPVRRRDRRRHRQVRRLRVVRRTWRSTGARWRRRRGSSARILERFDLGDHVGHLLEPIAGGVGTPARRRDRDPAGRRRRWSPVTPPDPWRGCRGERSVSACTASAAYS